MKLNKYQIVVITWGVAMFIGYAMTPMLLSNNFGLLAMWAALIAVSLGLQAKLMWQPEQHYQLTQWLWLTISLIGGILTYLGMFGYIPVLVNIHVLWLGLMVLGMIGTGVLVKNNSYYLLALAYLIPTIYFQIFTVNNDLFIVGLIFLILGVVDALLDYSPLRSNIADFEQERVI